MFRFYLGIILIFGSLIQVKAQRIDSTLDSYLKKKRDLLAAWSRDENIITTKIQTTTKFFNKQYLLDSKLKEIYRTNSKGILLTESIRGVKSKREFPNLYKTKWFQIVSTHKRSYSMIDTDTLGYSHIRISYPYYVRKGRKFGGVIGVVIPVDELMKKLISHETPPFKIFNQKFPIYAHQWKQDILYLEKDIVPLKGLRFKLWLYDGIKKPVSYVAQDKQVVKNTPQNKSKQMEKQKKENLELEKQEINEPVKEQINSESMPDQRRVKTQNKPDLEKLKKDKKLEALIKQAFEDPVPAEHEYKLHFDQNKPEQERAAKPFLRMKYMSFGLGILTFILMLGLLVYNQIIRRTHENHFIKYRLYYYFSILLCLCSLYLISRSFVQAYRTEQRINNSQKSLGEYSKILIKAFTVFHEEGGVPIREGLTRNLFYDSMFNFKLKEKLKSKGLINFKLITIFENKNNKTNAILLNKHSYHVVSAGDSIGDYKVVQISPKSLELESRINSYRLDIFGNSEIKSPY